MTAKQNNLLKDYADKKAELSLLQDELDEMEPKVISLLTAQGFDTLREEWGTYSIVYRKKWMYTPELIEKEMQYNAIIKQAKADEQTSGEAKAEEVKGLSYRKYEPKENK